MRVCLYLLKFKLPLPPSTAIEKYNMTSIRMIFSGAAPLGADLVATIRKRLQKVGANVAVSQGAITHLPLRPPH